ncbi:S9 family peptidase [Rossellomorea vietnamensis]|uniref:S9 family peptidase n=1 Tax=Rossellomorea vietnamensis TaxID=218284 RepID=A0A5D4KKR3_9BACI|nr:S9 family peptidase [Rossellomorea vietnamensis]TYR77852.1 S9 family peptidase [Rossellomorea vietnamensis]
MTNKRGITAEDLFALKSVSDPKLSPYGNEAVYVLTEMDQEKNVYISNLYHLNIDTGTSRQWTFGENRNSSPRWSPDGKEIAFVSDRSGKSQLYLLSVKGGEAQQLTHCPNGASQPLWSPCGTKIAFSAALKEGETLTEGEEDEKFPQPLEVKKMKYKSDDSGFFSGKRSHIAVMDLKTLEMKEVTEGEVDYSLQSWSPDGKYIAYGADKSADLDTSFQTDLFLYDIESGNEKKVTGGTGYFGNAAWSPDSRSIALLGHEKEYQNATLTKVWLYEMETESLSCLTSELDSPVGDFMVIDFQQGVSNPGIQWASDNQSFYFLASDNGNTVLYYGNLDGALYPALLEDQHIYGFDLDADNQKAIAAISNPELPGDLFMLDIPTGSLKQLTSVNEEFLSEVELSKTEALTFKSSDDWEVNGWLMKPAGLKEGEKYGLIVEVHGGPHMMYGNTYYQEFQMLAAEGYAVLFINPRGSHGYGQTFVDAVRGDYGGGDYEDVMAAVNHAIEKYDFIDKDRLGITGGSYGGFMTNWIVGHTDRFKAAVTQRSISNWVSFYGVSDIGYYFSEWQIDADLNDIEKLWKHSPLAYAKNINTPLLILHSEKDYRCPIEQAEQLYIAVKRQGKETEMVRFPESNHNLSRNGKPNLRVARLNYIKDWFGKYI